MGYPCCDICNEPLSWEGPPHECNEEILRKHVRGLEDSVRLAERNLNDMQNAVLMLLKELPSLEGNKISVSGDWLRKLWDTTKNCWYEAKTANDFLTQWLVTHRILCEAYDVFRSKKNGKTQTLLEKLKDLREACDKSKEVLGYQDSKFDLSPEDLAKGR